MIFCSPVYLESKKRPFSSSELFGVVDDDIWRLCGYMRDKIMMYKNM